MNVRLLVIGCGNELRGDDAVGVRVAEAVARWDRPGVQAVAVHQLPPELAALLAGAAPVVLVDASRKEAGAVTMRPLGPARAASGLNHAGDPRELLALTAALYGRLPEAWLVAVPAPRLGFGEGLSATAERGLAAALEQ